jgi:O-antigen ligase
MLMIFLVLYAIAIQTTMAGMEIFGWASGVFGLILWVSQYGRQSWSEFRKQWLVQPGDGAVALLFLVIVASVLINSPPETNKVFWIGSGRWVLLFFLMRLALSFVDFEKTQTVIKVLICLTGVIGLYGVQQHFVGHDYIRGKTIELFGQRADGSPFYRSNGLLSMHTRFGHMSAVWSCLPMAYWLCAERVGKFRWVALLCLLFGLLGLAASLTRADWLSFPVAALFVGVLSAMQFKRFEWKPLLTVAGVLAVVVAMIIVATPELKERSESIGQVNTYASNYQRVEIWKANIAIWKDFPVLGAGYGVNEALSPAYLNKLGLVRFTGGNAHSTYLQFLAGTGLLGLSAWLVFIATFFVVSVWLYRSLPQQKTVLRTLVLGGLGAQVVVGVTGLIDCNFHAAEITHAYTFIVACMAIIWVQQGRPARN